MTGDGLAESGGGERMAVEEAPDARAGPRPSNVVEYLMELFRPRYDTAILSQDPEFKLSEDCWVTGDERRP